MARPLKTGLDYFPHDVDASSDERLEALTALHSNDGYSLYFRLLELIYKTANGELNLSDERIRVILPRRLHLSRRRFERILADACSLGLFDKQKFFELKLLTSPGIRKRFLEVTKMRERWRDSKVNDLEEFSSEKTPQGKPHKENPIKESKAESKAEREEHSLPESIETAKAFFREQSFVNPDDEAAKFWSYYASKDWRISGSPISDWRKLASLWNERTKERRRNNGQPAVLEHGTKRVSHTPLSDESWKARLISCSACGRIHKASEICSN